MVTGIVESITTLKVFSFNVFSKESGAPPTAFMDNAALPPSSSYDRRLTNRYRLG